MKTATGVIPLNGRTMDRAVEEAGRLLREGKLVAFPTETVYGLGVHLEDPDAVARLYRVKGRPAEKALTLAIAEHADLKRHHIPLSPFARKLAERFWPGPLTLILRKEGTGKIGVRMPGHPVARSILQKAGVPIGLPSANPSGQTPPRSAEEVLAYFEGLIDLVLDGGRTPLGVSSTVVEVDDTSWTMVREGAIPEKEIRGLWKG